MYVGIHVNYMRVINLHVIYTTYTYMRNGCDDFGIVKKAPKGDTSMEIYSISRCEQDLNNWEMEGGMFSGGSRIECFWCCVGRVTMGGRFDLSCCIKR